MPASPVPLSHGPDRRRTIAGRSGEAPFAPGPATPRSLFIRDALTASGAPGPTAGDAHAGARIAAAVAAAAGGVPVAAILSGQRSSAQVATARQIAMYLAHVCLGLSQAEVARAFGRDRTTVAHACRRIEDMRDAGGFDETVARLEAGIRWAAMG